MKRKQYREGKVRVIRTWPVQIVGMALMVLALLIIKRSSSGYRDNLHLISLVATYVLGLALAIYPFMNKKYLARSVFICTISLLIAMVIGLVVLEVHSSLFSQPKSITKPTVS